MDRQIIKLSILIPAFNAGQFIARCIKSILNQDDVFDLQIIIINDGSTDNTENILASLSAQHQCIQYYTTQNQGVYKARNLGLSKVSGDYLWMLDADDYIDENAFKTLQQAVQKKADIDVLHCGYKQQISKNKRRTLMPPGHPYEILEGIEFLNRNDGRLYLWNNIYKTSFLRQYSFKFLAKSISLEDSLFNLQVLSKARKVMLINKPLYYYTINPNSISRTKTKAHLLKQGQSSINVHLETKKLRNQYQMNSKPFNIIQERLNHSVLGFFYSLYTEKYPTDYIQYIFSLYNQEKLLPVHKNTKQLKLKLFELSVNWKWPFILLCKLNRV